MQKKLWSTLLALCMLLGMFMAVPAAAEDVIEIATADDLVKLMKGTYSVEASYKLTADIDLTGMEQEPIATDSKPFTGSFDGNGHTISGIELSGTTYVALFAKVTGTVQNLTVKGNVTGTGNWVGGIVGLAVGDAIISDCINECTVSGSDASANVGGIAGRTEENALVKFCMNNGAVKGKSNVGGIVGGMVGASSVYGCWNKGTTESLATSGNAGVGGIVGYMAGIAKVQDCMNSGNIVALRQYAGGIVGQSNSSDVTVMNCYSNATITNNLEAADEKNDPVQFTRSIAGRPWGAVYTNCYYAAATALAGDAVDFQTENYAPKEYSAAEFDTLNMAGVWANAASPVLNRFGSAVSGVELKMTVGKTDYTLNGEQKTMDVAPIIINSRTMLPVRYVAEALGAEIAWDGATSTATLTTADTVIVITVGAATATVNGESVTLDSPAVIVSDRSFMPVRFVAETLGGTVAWDGATSTATITK